MPPKLPLPRAEYFCNLHTRRAALGFAEIMAVATPISAGYSAPPLCRCDGPIVCRSGGLNRTPFASPNRPPRGWWCCHRHQFAAPDVASRSNAHRLPLVPVRRAENLRSQSSRETISLRTPATRKPPRGTVPMLRFKLLSTTDRSHVAAISTSSSHDVSFCHAHIAPESLGLASATANRRWLIALPPLPPLPPDFSG